MPYRFERNDSWIKVKCMTRGTFTVDGYVPEGEWAVAALLLACRNGRELTYEDKVGTGCRMAESAKLWKRLRAMEVSSPASHMPQRNCIVMPDGFVDLHRPEASPTFLINKRLRFVMCDETRG